MSQPHFHLITVITVTYPDGSKDTIPGNKVVEGKSDAEKNEPKVPSDKVKVNDPNKLTEDKYLKNVN